MNFEGCFIKSASPYGGALFDAQDRQAELCLHIAPFAGRKNMKHEVRNVRERNRVGVSLLDCADGNESNKTGNSF